MSNLSRLHYEMICGLIQSGVCPSNTALAHILGLTEAGVEDQLRELAAIHGVVLHPHVCQPWILHPFSLTPTLNWIEGEKHSWWAPCIWCALGVATLVEGRTRIHTRIGAEAEPLVIETVGGRPVKADLWVHFAIPPVRAWDNVHQHCALVLPFHSPEAIRDWCARHAVPVGEPVPLESVAMLAKLWYGSHADPNWKKWTIAEAQQVFSQAGLQSSFWRLASENGHY
ncbi:MAG TPA: organomercurial lyase [Bryobacteraceae bacterium]|nr:organomercurial lyase [Bryobacteraceae bacterium]